MEENNQVTSAADNISNAATNVNGTNIEKVEIKDTDEIAILNIAGTSTHHVLFLDSYSSISEIEAELKDADAKINHTTLKIIGGHL